MKDVWIAHNPPKLLSWSRWGGRCWWWIIQMLPVQISRLKPPRKLLPARFGPCLVPVCPQYDTLAQGIVWLQIDQHCFWGKWQSGVFRGGVMALFRRATAGSNGHRDGWMVGGVCGGWMDGTLSWLFPRYPTLLMCSPILAATFARQSQISLDCSNIHHPSKKTKI